MAMKIAEIGPTELARRLSIKLGKLVKQQSVSHIAVRAMKSNLTPEIASICGVHYDWLAHGIGGPRRDNTIAMIVQPALASPVMEREALMLTVMEPEPLTLSCAEPSQAADQISNLIHSGQVNEEGLRLLLAMATELAKHSKPT